MKGRMSLADYKKKKVETSAKEIPKDNINPQQLSRFSQSLKEMLDHTDAILSQYSETP